MARGRWIWTAALVGMFTAVGAQVRAADPSLETATRKELRERLERAELLAGLTPVAGPGLVVTLRNSPRPVPRGADAKALQIHETDVNAVLNALRAAGAEALGVTGKDEAGCERVLASTAVRDGRNGLEVNGTALKQPYRVCAIGDARALRAELLREGGVIKKAGLDALQMIEVQESTRVTLPAARATGEFRYARAVEPGTGGGDEGATRTARSTEPPVVRPAGNTAPNPAAPPPVSSGSRTGEQQSGTTQPRSAEPRSSGTRPNDTRTNQARPPQARTLEARGPASQGTPQPALTGPVFGGKGLAKYHAPGCRFGERIAKGEQVQYKAAADAQKAGRLPCRICIPESGS